MDNGLVLNARFLNRRLTGVERYASELAAHLTNRLRQVGPGRPLSFVAGHFWEQVLLPGKIAKGELLWSPANIGPLAVANQVLTLHDISVLEHPGWFQPRFAGWYRIILPLLVRRVRRVLTVSQYSRGRILKIFPFLGEKVVVIPGGVNPNHFYPAPEAAISRMRQRYGLANEYLLFVGTLGPRKNLARLFEAWQLLQPELPGMELVIAGSPAPNFASIFPLKNLPALRFLGYVTDADLPAIYSAARACLLPSLEEGFGLTVLEAMACGTPVVASNAGALPETVGSAGVLVNPQETPAWVNAIFRLLTDRDCWLDFRHRGLAHARRFSWENTANRVWQALEDAR